MKNKKKGFTLIELLAVIVILAVIALIAVPMVLNLINKARQGAFARSAEGVLKASNLYYASSLLTPEGASEITFNCDGKKCVGVNKAGENVTLDVDGNIGTGYTTITSSGEVEILLTNGTYYAAKTKVGELVIQKGDGSNIDLTNDTTPPEITSINTVTSTNNITITVAAQDKESRISGYQYSIDGTNWYPNEPQKENTYTFGGLLKENEPYTIYIKVYNGTYGKDTYTEEKGMSLLTKDNIGLEVFDAPKIKVDPEGEVWTSSKTVEILFPEGDYTKEYSVDGGDTWIIYTDKIEITKETNIIAKITDGTNTKKSSKLINKIDVGESVPNVEYKTSDGNLYTSDTWTNSDVTITITPGEEGVEIDKYQITYDEGKTFEDIVGNKLTIDKEGTTKVQIKAIDVATHESELSPLYTINIDKTNPTVSYSVPSGTYTTNQSVTITANDANLDYMYIHVYKDGVRTAVYDVYDSNSYTVNINNYGEWTIYTQVYDKAKNKQDQTPDNGDGWYYQEYKVAYLSLDTKYSSWGTAGYLASTPTINYNNFTIGVAPGNNFRIDFPAEGYSFDWSFNGIGSARFYSDSGTLVDTLVNTSGGQFSGTYQNDQIGYISISSNGSSFSIKNLTYKGQPVTFNYMPPSYQTISFTVSTGCVLNSSNYTYTCSNNISNGGTANEDVYVLTTMHPAWTSQIKINDGDWETMSKYYSSKTRAILSAPGTYKFKLRYYHSNSKQYYGESEEYTITITE